jgi:hypothetical protein
MDQHSEDAHEEQVRSIERGVDALVFKWCMGVITESLRLRLRLSLSLRKRHISALTF